MLDNIPHEMRVYKQWIVWRYEDLTSKKPTKVPYNPTTGRLASVTDPLTWATYDFAVSVLKSTTWYSGIGFVLTDGDPFAFIDLDDTEGDPVLFDRQLKIFNEFNSYSEKSPSGNGLHIIVKGNLPSGRRRSRIEVYSNARYMTMTGDVYKNEPVKEANELLNVLWGQMGNGQVATTVYAGLAEAKETDEQVLNHCFSAANGKKALDLYEGRWQDYYQPPVGSQSEGDFALVDIIAFYTQNRAQISRIFQNSALGQRDKAKRIDYVNYMLNKCFDRMLPPVDIDGLRNQLEEILAKKRLQAEAPPELEEVAPVYQQPPKLTNAGPYTVPPGLVGEVAQFIYAQAPRPVAEIALAGAIGFLAGIVGRAYNVSATGLNQYVLLLAPTGCHAKDSRILMHDGSVKLVQDVINGDFLMGPDSKSRQVLNLARGRQQMARIVPTKGESFVVNVGHILPLVSSENGNKVNITVGEYLNSSKWFKHCHKLQRTGVEFKNTFNRIDPWFLGALLGDGCFIGSPSLTGMDEEIHKEALKQAGWFEVSAGSRSQPKGNKAWQIRFTSKRGMPNKLANELRNLGLWGRRSSDKFIPNEYKTANRNSRLALIAGLIDTDGSLSCNGYDYISKSKQLAKDVVFIARSLGLAAYLKPCEKQAQNGTGGVYYRVSISGNTEEIPLILNRKKAKPRQQKKSVLVTGFKVELLEEDDFYGFALSGDHLYLTDDFTIHHNTGKEAIASGIDKLMAQVIRTVPAAIEFIGPGEIASSQAVIKYMSKGPSSFVSLVGEFGIYMQQMASTNAPPHLMGLRRFLLDAYNKSGEGKVLRPSIYSDKDKNTLAVVSPSFTLLGESTPEKFYEGLHEGLISEGLLPRFTTIEYAGDRPPLNPSHFQARPSFELVDQVATLCAHALMLNSQNKAVQVNMSPEAKSQFDNFDGHCDMNINGTDREVRRHLWNRAHIKALKLAAVVAVGCNFYDPVITEGMAGWAINLITSDVRNLLKRFDAGEIGVDNDETKQLAYMCKYVKEYVIRPWSEVAKYSGEGLSNLHGAKLVPYSYLQRRLASVAIYRKDKTGASNAIKRTIKTLCDRGDFQEVSKATLMKDYNTGCLCFGIANPKGFDL